MTTAAQPCVKVHDREVLPAGSSIALSARLRVTIDEAESVVDLTGRLHDLVAEPGVREGTLQVYCGHTTCGLVINENDPGLHQDVQALLERLAPHSSTHCYAHDKHRTPGERQLHGSERDNGHSHARAQLATHPELNIPITAGALYLGRWQAVMLAEFDGPRTRELLVRVHDAAPRPPAV
ncbi:secondary thiamine-phosphate synthase enzyme YjbQ [Streptomyces sp. XH2]|uniref:secondary thiamine-phosphate synthase enzyme YjbQ n=1 Tax=Streptomyces sp. XH2 TaxID=3412483 RepID=UPI003C7B751A